MKAGFGKADITPSLGTRMLGFGGRDRSGGCQEVHDPLFVRALYLEHGGERALILAFDLCFFSRVTAERYKGALGRLLDLTARQILINFSHTHNGPATDMWSFNSYQPVDEEYLNALEVATLAAARQATDAARPVSVWAGTARTTLPRSRRRINAAGYAEWAPAPAGPIYNRLPVTLFKDDAGQPAALLFSVACHPSTIGNYGISADYPGVACARLNAYLQADCSLFLQGVGGDTKARVVGEGEAWRSGDWKDVDAAGEIVAGEVIRKLKSGLTRVEATLHCVLEEMSWPLVTVPTREELSSIGEDTRADELKRLWARRMGRRLEQGEVLSGAVPILAHGVQIGQQVRLIGLEGEAVAELGSLIEGFYGGGVTFPLGYTDGTQLYLPVSHMISERGYEVESYYEYDIPAPLARGMEEPLHAVLTRLYERGIA